MPTTHCEYGRLYGHPLQALADAITIAEFQTPHRPKVIVLGSASQSIATSCRQLFVEMMQLQDAFCNHTSRRL
jgi:N-succinyl-L-ornithine transcarbamylase